MRFTYDTLPFIDLADSIEHHYIEHERDFTECLALNRKATNIRQVCEWARKIEKYMATTLVCRICGSSEINHIDRDHPYNPIDIEVPARQFRITLDDYKRIMQEEDTRMLNLPADDVIKLIAELEVAIVELKVRKYRRSLRLMDIEKDLTDAQKKILYEKSKTYEVKDSPTVQSEDVEKKRAAAKSRYEKAVEMTMKMFNWDRERAEKFIAAAKDDKEDGTE